ncbi:IS4 family transposase [Dawidia soli]|uniref:IS4 family transposase n=1 Tax=Dawidia soli TaxID=2782352 RepID=UPI00293D9571|nr:IS4 family transposase [Dawidia soli]
MTGTLSVQTLQELAIQSGFCQRRSKMDMLSFLKMVLFDPITMEQPSLDQHCRLFLKDQGKSFCKQALDKRFNSQAVIFLKSLLERCLNHQLTRKLPSVYGDHFSAIRLMDSTEYKLPEALASDFPGFNGDAPKACMQIQFEYDILSSRLKSFDMMGARINDFAYAHPLLDNVHPKELIIRDLGYYRIDSFKKIEARGAYYISRRLPTTKIYECLSEDALDYKTLYQRLKKSRRGYLDMPVYLGEEAKFPVRLIVMLLPAEAVKRRRKKKIYRKNAHPEIYDYLQYMNVFITNVPDTMLSVNQINDLYRIRWQVEIMFKTWKSILKIDKVRKMKSDRVKCYLLGRFLWILLNWEMYALFNVHTLAAKKMFLSIYKFYAIVKDHVHLLQEHILRQRKMLNSWLKSLLDNVWRFGIKDEKKGRNLIKLLAIR